ncbi:MAG: helix-turn-helix domain-containing protein [Methanobrevibacter sp.]|nr:helix-turn-helix domain-containing protein [Methanobrevibacter sp.]
MGNGYAICFNEWALDNNIRNELRLLLIISNLTAKDGYCFASNSYFAEIFNETEISISRKIKNLEKNNYITIEYEKRGCEVIGRKIRLTKILIDDYQNCLSTINKNVKDNNTSINNTSINKKENIKRKIFEKPAIEEIEAYCKERQNGVNANAFYDFYQSKDWMVGKNKMKDWKACVRTWEQREKPKKSNGWEDAYWNE